MSKEKELDSEIQKFLEEFLEIEFDGKRVNDIDCSLEKGLFIFLYPLL